MDLQLLYKGRTYFLQRSAFRANVLAYFPVVNRGQVKNISPERRTLQCAFATREGGRVSAL
jgi:hypothetical protein